MKFRKLFRGIAPWCLMFAWIFAASDSIGFSQVVQVPTIGNFSISTSVSVPDSGAAYLGGNRTASMGSQTRGPLQRTAIGSQMSASSASVRATIIDLDEFDRMIRSQVGKNVIDPRHNAESASASKYANAATGTPARAADYEYLYAMSHRDSDPTKDSAGDAAYYLELAHAAKQKGHWHAVDLYYKMAWKSLPENRRNRAIEVLAQARAQDGSKKSGKSASSAAK